MNSDPNFYLAELLKAAYDTDNLSGISSADYSEHVNLILKALCKNKNKVNIVICVALHLAKKTFTGYYSFTFNCMARQTPFSEALFLKLAGLDQLNSEIKEFYPELFDNGELSATEKQIIYSIYQKEKIRLEYEFCRITDELSPEPNFFDLSESEDYTGSMYVYVDSHSNLSGIHSENSDQQLSIMEICDFLVDVIEKSIAQKIYLKVCVAEICENYQIESKLVKYACANCPKFRETKLKKLDHRVAEFYNSKI